MQLIICFLITLTLVNYIFTSPVERVHPDVGKNVLEIITGNGYPVEQHSVTTDDGYIIELHRIPHGINNAGEPDKPVVFVMHGLMSSSADWTNSGVNRSLAYLLADLGYDVWMGNARGTTWSREHVIYDPDVDLKDFWEFSWHEIGYYDLPASIDYALAATGQEKLFYIGHSQGTTAYFVMASDRPEYNDKIRLSSLFAPVMFVENINDPVVQNLSQNWREIEARAEEQGLWEIYKYNPIYVDIALEYCDADKNTTDLCEIFLFGGMGPDPDQLDNELIPVIASNAPAGCSVKQYIHFGQEVFSGGFHKYDHGVEENLALYGQETPPNYNISQITAPVAIYYGKNDYLTAYEDIAHLIEVLPNLVVNHEIEYELFNHIDFLWATDVVEMLYRHVFENLQNY